MTKLDFQELQMRAATCGTTLKEFLHAEGVSYSTYNYWCKKIKSGSNPYTIAPITISSGSPNNAEPVSMSMVGLPGVTLAFPNGVKAHFGRGSEQVLMEVLSRSIP